MNKILSIHMSKCNNRQCINNKICYLKNRLSYKDNITDDVYDYIIQLAYDHDIDVYFAIQSEKDLNKLSSIVNKLVKDGLALGRIHATIPIDLYKLYTHSILYYHIYNNVTTSSNNITSKVYGVGTYSITIKDHHSLFLALEICHKNSAIRDRIHFEAIHFPIDVNYFSKLSKEIINLVLSIWINRPKDISFDSCFENYIYNSKCMYEENYIDINYDNTYRSCPFSRTGTPIKNKDILTLYNKNQNETCIYKQLFGRKNENQ